MEQHFPYKRSTLSHVNWQERAVYLQTSEHL